MNTRKILVLILGFLSAGNIAAQHGDHHGRGDGPSHRGSYQRPSMPQGPLTTPAPLQHPPSINPVFNQMTSGNLPQQWRNQHQNWRQYNIAGKTSVYYPYYYPYGNYYPTNSYGVPYDPYAHYPNVYFVCYQIDKSSAEGNHISCPYRISWYSTSPKYDTYAYRTNYLPEYVCPKNGAPNYYEFGTINEADDWSNANCNQWIPNQ